MKLSIITINYNNANGLYKTMESVLNQTSSDFEYIVVDGGSVDGSLEIIQQFNSSTIQEFKWVSEQDNGIYHAMNKGIAMAKGEYCQFLNSGDWLVDEFVTEKMLQDLPNASFVYGNKIKVFSNGKQIYEKEPNTNSFLTFYHGSINHATTYIKRNLFDVYGPYDESLKIVSDWKFFLQTIALNNESVVYRNIDVVYFDMEGISNTNSVLDKSERKKVLEEIIPGSILRDYNMYWFDIQQINRLKRYKFFWFIVYFIERGLFQLDKLRLRL